MGSQKRTLRYYRQALIDVYYDAWMHEMLDPLYEDIPAMEAGNSKQNNLTELIHEIHRENQKTYSFFTQGRNQIIACIKMDNDWFPVWLKNNPTPPGVEP